VSYAGARGLMQLMPDTANGLGVKDINDPRENIFGGVRYLRVLANLFNGDLDLTVAAYNAGEGAIMKYGGIPPYAETRDYVVKVTHYYRRYRTIADPVEASLWSNPAPQAPYVVNAASPAAQPVSQGAPIIVDAK
jgi:soluble lytic murein transglycosylase-like protein